MANPIYKTVSFRRPEIVTYSIPMYWSAPMDEGKVKGFEERLTKVADPHWERPSNDELLGYLVFRAKGGEATIADRYQAIAIALLERADESFGKEILAEANAIQGTKIIPKSRDRHGLFDDLLTTIKRGSPSGIRGSEYLRTMRELAANWMAVKPQNENALGNDQQELLGKASLLYRGMKPDQPLEEFNKLRFPTGIWYPTLSNPAPSKLEPFLNDLIKAGVSREEALAKLVGALNDAASIVRDEEDRQKEVLNYSKSDKEPSSRQQIVRPPFGDANRTRQVTSDSAAFASKSLQPFHVSFHDVLQSAINRWTTLARPELTEMLSSLAGGKDAKLERDDFWRIINLESNHLEDLITSPRTANIEPSEKKPCVAAFGIGDLYVVEEEWLGNVAREISYIENARGGESRARIYERETEEVTYEESERTSEESKSDSLQTADRFEMQSMVASQTSLQVSANASVNVSGTYGVTSVQASAGATFGFSRNESASSTVTRAKETIAKATSEIRNNVREKRTKTLRERTLERDEHRFDATVDNSTVYRFVEKKYKVQVKQFGSRLFLEFIVPEPGRTLLSKKTLEIGLEPFTLTPDQISYDDKLYTIGGPKDEAPHFLSNYFPSTLQPANFAQRFGLFPFPSNLYHYARLQSKYDARGIEPPPRPMTLDFGISTEISEKWGAASQTIKVPEGYVAKDFTLKSIYPESGTCSVAVNGQSLFYHYENEKAEFGKLSEPKGPPGDTGYVISVYMRTKWDWSKGFKGYVNGSILVLPTNDRLQKWRMETWLRLREGYLNQLSEAEARLEEKMKGESVEDPPSRLRDKERGELQRLILCLMTGRNPNFSMVSEANILSDVYSFFVPSENQDLSSTMISFFDSAFEWHDMLTFYMPYLYGEQKTWTERLNLRTVDEKHRQFLAAGAARVMLPVAPGHEAEVLSFINTSLAGQEGFFEKLEKLEADKSEAAFTEGLPDLSTNMLREILCERNDKYRLGAGKLSLNGPNFTVKPQDGYPEFAWVLDARFDIGREVLIEGTTYIVSAVTSDTAGTFSEDTLRHNQEVEYFLGAVPIGNPWIEYIPTPLVIIGGQESKLGEVQDAKKTSPPLAEEAATDANLETAMLRLSTPLKPSASPEAQALRKDALKKLQDLETDHQKKIKAVSNESKEATTKLLENSKKRQKGIKQLIDAG